MITFHDPRATVGLQMQPYELSIDLHTTSRAKVAFLANGFPDSVRFLEKLAAAMRAHQPAITAEPFDKGDASVIAGDHILDAIGRCDAAVAAYGH